MPELPEVEVLVRHLRPLLHDKTIEDVDVRRARVLTTTSPRKLRKVLRGARFETLTKDGLLAGYIDKMGKQVWGPTK